MKESSNKMKLPSLRGLMENYSDQEIQQAEKNLLAYADFIVQVAEEIEVSSDSDCLLTDKEITTNLNKS